jgi:hypothetical protein
MYKWKEKTTPHINIMEQLRIRADRFRKQGRLQDKNLEEIISTIRAEEDFKCKKEEQQCNINGNG